MILTELYELSQRLDGSEQMPSMYGKVRIRWLIPINTDGSLRGNLTDLQGASKAEQRGKEFVMPDLVRSSGIKPKLLADNGEYVLGLQKEGSDGKKVAERHRQFKELVQHCGGKTQNPAVLAVSKFLQTWKPETLAQQNIDPADNFTFEVYGIEPDRPVIPANAVEHFAEVQQFWATYTAGEDSPMMTCLVTGKLGPVEARLPVKIKGIPNGQTAGTSLVSANADPFTSYGLENSLTSPISRDAGEGFGKALNYLIATPKTRLYLGPVVYTFWAKGNVEVDSIVDCFEEDQPEEARNLFNSSRTGQVQYGLEGDRFYALGLSASGGRAVVRNWIDVPIKEAQRNLDVWWDAQKIVNEYGQYPEKPYLRIRSLLNSLYRDPAKEINTQAAKLIEVALKGGKLPWDLLGRAVQRIRVEHEVRHNRAAMIKLILTTQLQTETHNPMNTMNQLDLDPPFENIKDKMAYHCGRLLAQLENIQKAALGDINTTLIDRYYSAASSTPGKVFGELVKDAQAHLRKLRVTKPGVCEALQQKLEAVMVKLPAAVFPDTLTMQQQSIFALGYYHQRAENRREAIVRKAESEAKKAESKTIDT